MKKKEKNDKPYCPWLRRSVTVLSLRSPGFDDGPDRVKFLLDKLALVRGLLRVLRFSPVSVIPSMLRTQLLVCYRRCVILTNEHTNKYFRPLHCIHFYSRNIGKKILMLVNVPIVYSLRNAMQVWGRQMTLSFHFKERPDDWSVSVV